LCEGSSLVCGQRRGGRKGSVAGLETYRAEATRLCVGPPGNEGCGAGCIARGRFPHSARRAQSETGDPVCPTGSWHHVDHLEVPHVLYGASTGSTARRRRRRVTATA